MPDRFNLERAIVDWRSQLTLAGMKSAKVLDELEAHLRDTIDRQTRAGAGAEAAFNAAVKQIGTSSNLKSEFAKINGWRRLGHTLMLILALVVLIIFGFFASAAAYLCYSNWSERVLAFSGLGATVFIAFRWKRAALFLPVVANYRKRALIEWGSLIAGIVASTFFCQVILPHFERTVDRQLPAIGAWAMLPLMLGMALMLGLEESAKRVPGEGRGA